MTTELLAETTPPVTFGPGLTLLTTSSSLQGKDRRETMTARLIGASMREDESYEYLAAHAATGRHHLLARSTRPTLGHPACLPALATQAVLVVVGSRDRKEVAEVLVGSTNRYSMTHAQGPVSVSVSVIRVTTAAAGAPAVIGTHLSWVIFIGEHAFKLKGPVRTPFLDFSTPDRRREACKREVRLHRRLAPDVYEGVATITGPDGAVCDHLVVMRRMPAQRRLAAMATTGSVAAAGHIGQIAEVLAGAHAIDTDRPREVVLAEGLSAVSAP